MRKARRIFLIVLLVGGYGLSSCCSEGQAVSPTHTDDFAGRPRVIVISDIGNEPDDQMSSFGCCSTPTNSTSKE